VLNVPNQISIARLVLAVILFALLTWGYYVASFVIFMLAVFTDWIDGYWARKYGQITQLGRMLDPFADKLVICGTFVFLAAVDRLADGTSPSGIAAWMAVVILARELLITALRSFVEQQGGDFSAKWIGKWKMAFQCLAAGWSMVHLSYLDATGAHWQTPPPEWMTTGLTATVWLAMLITVYSGVSYIRAALDLLRKMA